MTPTFSILVPCYNHAKYVGAALDSLLAQTDGDWEAVVVNDGSSDGSGAVLDAYAHRDPRIRVFHKANGGVSSALNAALVEARGTWVCWLSSDDLFDVRKLALHREWFRREPGCRFFFTHFRELNDQTGVLSEPDLWQPLPDQAMQGIRLMRGNYMSGISICVRRDVFAVAGRFDEDLRVSQDYDMWLRLLAISPAVFIPDRTCVTRVHIGQDSQVQRERCFVEASSACLAFLNLHGFESLFPMIDWANEQSGRRAIEEAIGVAANPHAFLYGLGPHLALIHRIMEWLWRAEAPTYAVSLRDYFRVRARTAALSQGGNALGHVWRLAWLVATGNSGPCPYTPVDAYAIGCGEYARRIRSGRDATALGQYLERRGGRATVASGHRRTPDEAVVVMHVGSRVDARVRYGANRMTVLTAGALQDSGCRVVLMGLSQNPLGTTAGIPFVGARDDEALRRHLQRWHPRDTVIASSRTDVARWCHPRRLIVHHHSISFPPGGLSAKQINRLGVNVCCVSKFSLERMISFGIAPQRLTLVANGYEDRVFGVKNEASRQFSRLIVVGDLCHGKGTDIILRAMEYVHARIPEVNLHLYGFSHVWSASERAGMPAGWFDDTGRIDWAALARDCPYVSYHGEATPQELATAYHTAGLLVQPSREENFPLVALEAQACGCLPVLPNHGGMPETIIAGETGFLYEPNTPECLGGVLVRRLAADSTMEVRRAKARTWVAEHYSRDAAAASFLDALMRSRPMGIVHCASAGLLRARWATVSRLSSSLKRLVGASH